MSQTSSTPKPRTARTIGLLIVAAIVLVMTFNIVTHWSDFMRGFHEGYAAGAKKTEAAK